MRSRQQRKKPPHSVQETIPYERMWPDGICRVSPSYYTKTVQFWDINYQLAQNEDKSAIFEGWCDFLNAFDSSVHLQLSFLNLTANADAVEQRILLPDKADGFDAIRREYTEMLQNQLAKGSNGLSKRKYLTFGVESENYRTAKPRLERIETDLLNHFKRLGAAAAPMDGRERLKRCTICSIWMRRHRSCLTGNGLRPPDCARRTLSFPLPSNSGSGSVSAWAAK